MEFNGSMREQERTYALPGRPGYRCIFCDAVHEEQQDVCPVCQAICAWEACVIR